VIGFEWEGRSYKIDDVGEIRKDAALVMTESVPILKGSVLDRLLDDDPRAGDPYLDPLDIKDPPKLLERLKRSDDRLSLYILKQFLPEWCDLLNQANPQAPISNDVVLAMTDGLNQVVRGPLLYEPTRFEGRRLTPEMIRLMEDSRRTTQTATLNRILLDEVFGDAIHKMRKPSPSAGSIREMKAAISRDIEALLNTRRELLLGADPEFKEVGNSLLMFGLPDFTSYSLLNSDHRKSIRRAVEEALAKFEPRLKSVRVTLEPTKPLDPLLHFRIDALLRIEPLPQPVTFDAALQLGTNAYRVRGEV
jgi:type VI secretion system protein ImpF